MAWPRNVASENCLAHLRQRSSARVTSLTEALPERLCRIPTMLFCYGDDRYGRGAHGAAVLDSPGTPRSTPMPDLPPDRHFDGSRLRHARKLLRLNQAEAAARVPTTQGRWSEYETGVHEPSAASLPRVCGAVELPIDLAFVPVDGPEAVAK